MKKEEMHKIMKDIEVREAYKKGIKDALTIINFKIKDLKKRMPKCIMESSKYCMKMSIEELNEIKQRLTVLSEKENG